MIVRCPSFHHFQSLDLQHFETHRNNSFQRICGIFLDLLRYPGVSKENNMGFGAQGHVQKSRNDRNEGPEGSHITKSKSYKFKLEQNNTTELLSISFPKDYHTSRPAIATIQKIRVCPGFS